VYTRKEPVNAARLDQWHRSLLDADLVVLDQAGHLPFIEQPDAFIQAVSSWLQQRVGKPRR
jgi:pimeloyl-ACP methyl ester carboxylesterase